MTNQMLAFYREHAIAPVRQNVMDITAHFSRRAALYRSLGLPPMAFEDRAVLEVGPGSGENALYTLSLRPRPYIASEPNEAAREAFREAVPYVSIDPRSIEEIPPTKGMLFHVVLCEGLLGLSGADSLTLLHACARQVAPGGVLVITCIDPISDHAEIVRRAIAQQILDRQAPLAEQLAQLRPIFAPHLATLAGMTRSVDDWILDNLLNPASIGPTFSIPEACDALDAEFDLLGCSPRFLTDWRWYKQATSGNAWAIESYWHQAHNLLDYRRVLPPRDEAKNRELMAACLAYREQLRAFEAGDGPAPDCTLSDIGWFGRGQQYLSFVRRWRSMSASHCLRSI